MRKKENFTMDEIPYEILSEHGLSQEMVDDLPENVIESLLTGGRTPVLPFNIDDKKGKARISLVRTNAGVDVFVMPYFSHINMEGFDEEQQKTLRSGKVLLASFEGKPDMYYQLDETTNQIVSCPKSVIEHNLEILTKQVGVPEESAKQLSTGEVITFTKGQGCITYSVDLSEEKGIKMSKGNSLDKNLNENKLPRYSFGIYGCWVNDENNNLSYVNEEDYTDEMQDIQSEIAQKKKRSAAMGR